MAVLVEFAYICRDGNFYLTVFVIGRGSWNEPTLLMGARSLMSSKHLDTNTQSGSVHRKEGYVDERFYGCLYLKFRKDFNVPEERARLIASIFSSYPKDPAEPVLEQ